MVEFFNILVPRVDLGCGVDYCSIDNSYFLFPHLFTLDLNWHLKG
jgi:hypothetical protein